MLKFNKMNSKSDLDKIGKRLPYIMPPETFNEIEANVFETLNQDRRNKKSHRIIRWSSISGIAVAASIALLLAVAPKTTLHDDLLTQIDQAYANLSETDQQFLIEIWQDDIFLNQEMQ